MNLKKKWKKQKEQNTTNTQPIWYLVIFSYFSSSSFLALLLCLWSSSHVSNVFRLRMPCANVCTVFLSLSLYARRIGITGILLLEYFSCTYFSSLSLSVFLSRFSFIFIFCPYILCVVHRCVDYYVVFFHLLVYSCVWDSVPCVCNSNIAIRFVSTK